MPKIVRVVREITYEGYEDWVDTILAKSLDSLLTANGFIHTEIKSRKTMKRIYTEDFTSDRDGRVLYKGQIIGKGGEEDE